MSKTYGKWFDSVKKSKSQNDAEEAQYKEEAMQSTDEVTGTDTLEGTGYKTFKDLVAAKRKKQKEFEETRKKKGANNFASLLGRFTTLG